MIALIVVGVMIATTILVYVFVFREGNSTSGNGPGDGNGQRLFEITSVEILLSGSSDFRDIEIGVDDLHFELRINDGADLSGYDEPKITWGFYNYNNLSNSIDDSGKFILGNTLGSVDIVATVTSKNIKTTQVSLRVVAKAGSVLDSIRVKTPPNRATFIEGQSFVAEGMEVEATFDHPLGGRYSAIIAEYKIISPTVLSQSDNLVEISYTHDEITRSVNLPITVVNRQLQRIEVTSVPKLNYVEGQKFDSSNLEVTAFFEHMSLNVTEYANIEVDEILSPQSTQAIISFIDGEISKSVVLSLHVRQRVLQSIEVDCTDVRLEYTQGDFFDVSGLVVVAKYEYMDRQLVADDFDIIGIKNRLLTTDTAITIRYEENGITKQYSIPIIVHAPFAEMRTITFVSDNIYDVSLSWRYEYMQDDKQMQIDEIYNNFEVPFGAIVTLVAHNPAIMWLFIDEGNIDPEDDNAGFWELSNNVRSVSFVLLGSDDIEVRFEEMPGSRVTVRFFSEDKLDRFITNITTIGDRLSARDLFEIESRFFEGSLLFNNQYIIGEQVFSLQQVSERIFYENTTIIVQRQLIRNMVAVA